MALPAEQNESPFKKKTLENQDSLQTPPEDKNRLPEIKTSTAKKDVDMIIDILSDGDLE